MNRVQFSLGLAMLLVVMTMGLQAQRDTLRLMYQGVKTEVLDSNETKIAEWAKKLPKGVKTNIDIIAYYDNGDFKKFMVERVENVFLMVNRKARDLVKINKSEAIRGKKNQRYQVDIIFDTNQPVAQPAPVAAEPAKAAAVEPKKEEKREEPKKQEPKPEKAAKKEAAEKKPEEKKEVAAEPKKEQKKQEDKPMVKSDKYDYIVDSTYVNGVLKVTTRKVKKK